MSSLQADYYDQCNRAAIGERTYSSLMQMSSEDELVRMWVGWIGEPFFSDEVDLLEWMLSEWRAGRTRFAPRRCAWDRSQWTFKKMSHEQQLRWIATHCIVKGNWVEVVDEEKKDDPDSIHYG